MSGQLFTYYLESHLVIISINSGSWEGLIVVWKEIETWVISKSGAKRGIGKEDGMSWGRGVGAAGFWGPVCLRVVPLL
jgi:hypothetical protein